MYKVYSLLIKIKTDIKPASCQNDNSPYQVDLMKTALMSMPDSNLQHALSRGHMYTEASSTMRALASARCISVRLYT